MVDESIIAIVSRYLDTLRKKGIPVPFGVIYGSQATGGAHQWSDIDLLVVSPRFDRKYRREIVNILWRTAAHIDSRIEPIPVGVKRYETEDGSPLLTIDQGHVHVVSAMQ
jgi:predicted nucleotidyltransferase